MLKNNRYNLRNQAPRQFENFEVRTKHYSDSYYPYCVEQWNILDPSIRTKPTISQFKTEIFRIIRPPKRNIFGISDINGVRLLTRLRVDFSDLKGDKFRHNFNCNDPTCSCGTGSENVEHYLLHCPLFSEQREVLLDSITILIDRDARVENPYVLTQLLLYGNPDFNYRANRMIIEVTLLFIRNTRRFSGKQ